MPAENTPLVSSQDDRSVQYINPRPAGQKAKSIEPGKQTPLPKMQLFALLLIQFCEPVTGTVIYPFVVSLVNETGMESAFFASEGLTAFAWGRASDRIGRKIPLVIGMLCMAAAIASFGLSNSYWLLVISRCILGVTNGNIGITKSAMADMTDSTNMAKGRIF
ncbi:hypothetical protein HWV62_6513 [Athelia sp. TMB]|nr:hypothetical protein HWV62_6513 [Athelia sp. TMB]